MRDPADSHFTATGVGGVLSRPKTFKEDRVCADAGCETRLSRYNTLTLCWQHGPGRASIVTPRRKRKQAVSGPVIFELNDAGDLRPRPLEPRV